MPIIVKDYVWRQTESDIVIRLPLKGVGRSKVNVFSSKDYIKINYSPFFFEAFLLCPIKQDESKCKVMKNEIILNLVKEECVHWDTLSKEIEKDDLLTRKNEIINEYQIDEELRAKERSKIRAEKKRVAVDREIRRTSSVRESIEQLEKNVFRKEMQSVAELKQTNATKALVNSPDANSKSGSKVVVKTKPKIPAITSAKPERVVPAIRKPGHIEVNFTKRSFVTPQRESQAAQEKEWILKQTEAKKIIGFVEEDLRPEERNPEWLKEKGDDFFKKNNYLAAISAYTTGIRLTDKYYQLFLNRSAVQFAMGNFQRCIEDCSKAFDLLQPAIDLNLKARKQCLARRGAALCKLGYLKPGYDELAAAIKLDPTDESLKADAQMIQMKLDMEVSSDEETEKVVYIENFSQLKKKKDNLKLSKDNTEITEGKLDESADESAADSDSSSSTVPVEIIE